MSYYKPGEADDDRPPIRTTWWATALAWTFSGIGPMLVLVLTAILALLSQKAH